MTGTTTIKPEMLFSHLDPEIEVGTYPLFRHFPEISHFVTLRGTVVPDDPFSSFNLGRHSGEDLSRVMKNRDRLCRALSLPSSALVQPRQVHGNEVLPLLPDFFSLTDEAQAEYLSQAGYGEYYSTDYTVWKEKAKQTYDRLNKVLGAVRGCCIEDCTLVGRDVYKVDYSGGRAVLVNFSHNDYKYDNTVVPARDFILI